MTHIPQIKSLGSTLQYFILVLKTLTGMGSTGPKEHSSFHNIFMLLLNMLFFFLSSLSPLEKHLMQSLTLSNPTGLWGFPHRSVWQNTFLSSQWSRQTAPIHSGREPSHLAKLAWHAGEALWSPAKYLICNVNTSRCTDTFIPNIYPNNPMFKQLH